MGITLCDIHGESGMIGGCRHAKDYFYNFVEDDENKLVPEFDTFYLTILIFVENIKISGLYGYCNKCSLNYRFYGRGFSNIFHLIINPVNIYKFINNSKYICIDCVFKGCFGLDKYNKETLQANLNLPIKIKNNSGKKPSLFIQPVN
ncbi:MAG: hypothetical protein R2747_09075 [Pyrinomonadaceae bacterium]